MFKLTKMNTSKAFRMLILVFSFLMFIWQASKAIGKLMDPPVVDSTERLKSADIEPLLITICPLGQWNKTMLIQNDYRDELDLLKGYSKTGTFVGWGAQHNLTFEELVAEVSNYNLSHCRIHAHSNNIQTEVNYEIRFYPPYGFCYDLLNLTTVGILDIWTENTEYKAAQVYITDKKLKTKNFVFTESHWGSKIFLELGLQEYFIETKLLSNFDPRNPDVCRDYRNDDYEKCVDDELQEIWKPLINCNPPWLSSQDQCDSTFNITQDLAESIRNKTAETVHSIYWMTTFPAKERCKKSCTFSQPNVLYGKHKPGYDPVSDNMITLNFAEEVVYTTKKLAFRHSDFLIDMGSSLGLWFGLSVFGITDLGIMAFLWVKESRKELMRNFMSKGKLII